MKALAQLGVFFNEIGLLAVSDLQLGYEEVLASRGVSVPASQYPQIERGIGEMLDETKARRILFNGDVKHEFSRPLQQEWGEVTALLDFISARGVEPIFVRGNHDNYISSMLRARHVRLVDFHAEAGFLFVHGHQLLEDYADYAKIKGYKTLVIGHVHPALTIRDEIGVPRKFRCMLEGTYRRKPIIVLPSISPLAGGFDVTRERANDDFASPILAACDVGKFVPTVIDSDGDAVRLFPQVRYLG
ncbi:MAG: metallophosphoesterase [Candidatus Micrarchaeota archaeon]